MSEKPLLSISLLSSGRSSTIERCLSSLSVFKENMKTEIIVVDTDPEHRSDVRRVYEKYADKIIPFEWCNDFSVARNVSVDAAKGEWYLYIDDDEWFIDAQPIIDFLLSDEKNKWGNANHLRLDYYGNGEKDYRETWVSRMFRLDGRTRFRAKVHEYYYPMNGEPKNLPAVSGHSGYIFKTLEEKLAHSRRNLTLLEEMVAEEPNEVRWVYQLVLENASLGNRERELELAHQGYQMMKGVRGYRFSCIRGIFAADVLRIKGINEEWKACLYWYNHFRSEGEPLGRMSRAWMEMEAGQAAYHLRKRKESKRHLKSYLHYADKLKESAVECAEDYLYFAVETFSIVNMSVSMVFLILMDLEDRKWDAWNNYFKQIEWVDSDHFQFEHIERTILEKVCFMEFDERISETVKTFWLSSITSRKILQRTILNMTAVNDENRWNLIHALAEANLVDEVPWDIKIIWDDHIGKRENMQKYFTEMFQKLNPLWIDISIWEAGVRRGAIIDDRISEIPMERWKLCVEDYLSSASSEDMKKKGQLLDNIYLGTGGAHYEYYRFRTAQRLQELTDARMKEAAKEKSLQEKAIQHEMSQLLNSLEKKVDELVAAGLLDEAEKVVQEIEKYTAIM